jgi:hypothetical protein
LNSAVFTLALTDSYPATAPPEKITCNTFCLSPLIDERAARNLLTQHYKEVNMPLRETLTAALKSRIERDRGFTLAPGWEKVLLGQFYPSSDPRVSEAVIETVIGEVLNGILSAHGRIISSAAWADLFSGIDPTTTPESAIGKMLDAAATSIPKPHTTPFFLNVAAEIQAVRRETEAVEERQGRSRSIKAAKKPGGSTASKRRKKDKEESES